VFEHYPHFKNRMMDALIEIFGLSADNIKLVLARDGSGVGAALIAAVMGDHPNGPGFMTSGTESPTFKQLQSVGTVTDATQGSPGSGRSTPKLFRRNKDKN
jgi:hypothetical protein